VISPTWHIASIRIIVCEKVGYRGFDGMMGRAFIIVGMWASQPKTNSYQSDLIHTHALSRLTKWH